jgi:hypothetical protein
MLKPPPGGRKVLVIGEQVRLFRGSHGAGDTNFIRRDG